MLYPDKKMRFESHEFLKDVLSFWLLNMIGFETYICETKLKKMNFSRTFHVIYMLYWRKLYVSIPSNQRFLFCWEELLADIIVSSEYYKSLFRFNRLELIIEEFLKHAKNLEPRIPGLSRKASTAFCVLYKLFTMNLGQKRVQFLLQHDEAKVRCLGLLLLR